MIPNNQLSRRILSKNIRGLGGSPLMVVVGGDPNEFIQVWIRPSPKFTTNVEYKIYHISKTKNHKIVKLSARSVSEHCTYFGTKKKIRPFKKFWTTISQKLKIAKVGILIFHTFQNIAQLFGPKKNIGSFWEKGGGSACR